MSVREDPHGLEREALFDLAVDFNGKRILEIGCGNGRLTWEFAHQAAHVTGIDPDCDKIAKAIANTPDDLIGRVKFSWKGIEEYTGPDPFDLVIFSWSL